MFSLQNSLSLEDSQKSKPDNKTYNSEKEIIRKYFPVVQQNGNNNVTFNHFTDKKYSIPSDLTVLTFP